MDPAIIKRISGAVASIRSNNCSSARVSGAACIISAASSMEAGTIEVGVFASDMFRNSSLCLAY